MKLSQSHYRVEFGMRKTASSQTCPRQVRPPPTPTDLNFHFPLQKCHNLGVKKKKQQLTRPYADFLGELRQVEEIYEWVKAGYQAQMEAA